MTRWRWDATDDFQSIIDMCESWNSGRLHEIFWQYSSLSPTEMKRQGGIAWIFSEDGMKRGFALARRVYGIMTIEELWCPIQGWYGPEGVLSNHDIRRISEFEKVLEHIERPLRIRAPIDNCFANALAMKLGLKWQNGMVLAVRNLTKPLKVKIPDGFNIRPYQEGDEQDIQGLHELYYNTHHGTEFYREWVNKPECETLIAETPNGFAGHIIAERRHDEFGDFDIAVASEHLRKGIGSALLLSGLNSLYQRNVKKAIADYMTMNEATNGFYQRHKFHLQRVYNYFLMK
ncbi:MAG: GNAT family N-acetyltransferase [Candidatus Thermoplasmatota archaeon]|jgi:ribosomal protein S18 acetylase RimI-like enzyme|nr:GNAT family N-acetyltransferase [Candidatus Thermoplasmatota archaeon]MCL5790276.1 GNAT family N-acetyltransferase [Candidatus Thermoplasmatota archaeon]